MAKRKTSRKKRVFFLPLMFIGMGIGFLFDSLLGYGFAACMFIGMGLGFLLDSLFVMEERKLRWVSPNAGSFALVIIGTIFVIVGVVYLLNPSLLEALSQYLVALGFLAFGIYLLIKGFESAK